MDEVTDDEVRLIHPDYPTQPPVLNEMYREHAQRVKDHYVMVTPGAVPLKTLSEALDEALILEAHLGYKTFPKSRRKFAEPQVERMLQAARGDYKGARREDHDPKRAFRMAGLEETMTRAAWENQRGLR